MTRLMGMFFFLSYMAAVTTVVQSSEVFVASTNKENDGEAFVAPDVIKEPAEAFISPDKSTEAPDIDAKAVKEPAPPSLEPAPVIDANMRCRWGEHCPNPEKDEEEEEIHVNTSNSQTLPFVPPKKPIPMENGEMLVAHRPPEGFVLTARVYTDSTDKRAHFDHDTQITLPYWECGAVGSTTSPLQVKHAYFRHALGGTHLKIWQGTEYGPHPHLLIPLGPLEVTVSSGESRIFQAGDIILLEDVLQSGHKMRAVEGDLDALIVTLPQHYHHVGKDRVSLAHSNNKGNSPCPNDLYTIESGWNSKRSRQVAFGAVGVAASSMLTFFLSKVAPPILAVGFGGTTLIVCGTAATIKCGEAIIEHVQTVLEQKRLAQYNQDDDEEEEVVDMEEMKNNEEKAHEDEAEEEEMEEEES